MPRTEVIPGRRAVREALRSGRDATTLYVANNAQRDEALADITDLARRLDIDMQIVSPNRLRTLAQTPRHQGVILMALPRGPITVGDLLDIARQRDEDPFLVCVDGVEDPQNVGAIARSALLAGAHGLVVPERGAARLGPGAMRASAGALSSLAVAEVSSLPSALGVLKREEVWAIGADASGGKPVWSTRMLGPTALVLGSEHQGLSPTVKKLMDAIVHIPTPGGGLSLNVSAAAAVLLFERVRQAALVK